MNPLITHAQVGNADQLATLISQAQDLNVRDTRGRTPLHLAARVSGKATEVLVNAKAKLNLVDSEGRTPLMIAAAAGRLDAVEILLSKRKTKKNHQQKETKETALMMAARRGNEHVVRALIKAGAKKDCTNKDKKTAMDLAANERVRSVIRDTKKAGFLSKRKS